MRSSLTSSPIPPFILRSFKYPRPLCSQPECPNKPISSESPFSGNPESNLDSPEKITPDTLSLENPTFSESKQPHYASPTLETTDLTPTDVINTLISYKNDPISALKYFNRVGRFVKSLDSFCVLLHILMKSPETGHARKSLNHFVSGFSGTTIDRSA
ncbi:hypothetical protein Patl1_12775 [Pistacia atlantica]|uniref:Uncharacterized protein n=1 Tax=Pistacia atlantica TaxID=434234 RepID=A0ACC1AUU7_9ROSI|nr:hypothetical protein Patl1_12775 [Pistacia atlantica]